MSFPMSPLIEINDPAFSSADTVLIDARGGQDSHQRYLNGHLKNAIYADLDKHLAAKVTDASQGGRHPLPDVTEFSALLGNWGITPQSHVIINNKKNTAKTTTRKKRKQRALGH